MQHLVAVEHALGAATPDQLVNVLQAALGEQYGAHDIELRLVDYGMRSLQPAQHDSSADTRPASVDGTPQGRVFGSQEPYVANIDRDELTLHVPATVRGDRVGVLSATIPAHSYTSSVLEELRQIGTAIAREVVLAGRETDRFEVERRTERLTLAAEMQWLVLPSSACTRPEFSLGAHLEPAYAIYGDGFDWSVSATDLTVVVANGIGEGVTAALLTNLTISALRNARRAGLSLADQAALADEAVFAQFRGKTHIAALLLRFELDTGRIEVVDAGSPRVWRLRGGAVEPMRAEEQMPLGMFGDSTYRCQPMQAEPGDRLLIASDGVYAATSANGESYDERALARSMRASRLLRPAQVPSAMLRDLARYHGGAAQDDAVIMCIDWHGRPEHGTDPA